MIAVIDYGSGNLRSIRRALEAAGTGVVVTDSPADLTHADAVVLPGVGHAGHAITTLTAMGFTNAIYRAVDAGKPFLGICVGMQLLFGHQEEGDANGLQLLPGSVVSLAGDIKVPHMGWNWTKPVGNADIGIAEDGDDFYYVHSFVTQPDNAADVAAVVSYGGQFPAVVQQGNIVGTQFHPEKSGPAGLRFMRKWVDSIVRAPASVR